MGHRTVVMLNNDRSLDWESDPDLGALIATSMNHAGDKERSRVGDYGRVVECVHADAKTIAVIDGYSTFHALARSMCRSTLDDEAIQLALLKEAADKLGFRLVKKAKHQ